MGQCPVEFAAFKAVKFAPSSIKEGEKSSEKKQYPPRGIEYQGHGEQKRNNTVQQVEDTTEATTEKHDRSPFMCGFVLYIVAVIIHDQDIRRKQSDRQGQ